MLCGPMAARDLSVLRADFPALQRRRNGKPPIYMNNTCMTLRPRPVIEAITRYYEEFPTCGGGRAEGAKHLHNWFMEELKLNEEGARDEVRRLLNAKRCEEIVWTRNTSEALNIVARGLALEPGDEVLGSEREHNSNLVPWLEVERRLQVKAGDPTLKARRCFDLAPDGSFSLENALAAITPRTKVVALGHSSNLDGTTISNGAIAAIAKKIHANGGVLVLDAAQSVPHVPVDVQALDCDFLAFSIHKMCGPSGVGALYGRHAQLDRLAPFIVGGDTIADTWQDRVVYKEVPGRFEAGLQDYAGMLGAAEAIRYVRDTVGLAAIQAHEHRLNAYMTERLAPLECDHFWIRGPRDPRLRGGVLTMSSSSGAILNAIERLADERWNVMLRKGMFCVNAYLHRRFDATGSAKNNLRAGVYFYNTEEECDALCTVVEQVVKNPLDYLDDE
jgi:cysteine desulfurase / selenocysteine lyase